MIEVGLVALLQADADMAALVGTRIYPVLLPPNQGQDGVYPALTYQLAGGKSDPSYDTSGLITLRMQFDAWGDKYSDASITRKTLVQVLNGYRGALPDGTFLEDAQYIQPMDYFVDKLLLYRCAVEFYLRFTLLRP